ncbi:MAG: hypothetical protein KAJ22_00130 [Candidatus Izimaplasma sp.]|nr:hypothetical protein [Candidatus Izimaplasma bacterium]
MKITFIKYKKFLIAFMIIFIPLMVVGLFPVDYSLVSPGFNDNIINSIRIDEGLDTGSTFHTTSVVSIDEITILQYILGSWDKNVAIKDLPTYYDDIEPDDLLIMGQIMKDDSIATSIVVGMENAEESISYTSFLTVFLVYNTLTPDSLEFGDHIVKINGIADMDRALSGIACGDFAEFEVIRDGETIVVNVENIEIEEGKCSLGVYLDYYTVLHSFIYRFTVVENSTGGPSGGLMQSLYIYYSLEETNLDSGLKIAGTGTIDVLGNVGYIGGIEQKIATAIMNGMDVFFVPHLSDDEDDNYIMALEFYNTFDTDMELVGVSSFLEALEYLTKYHSGDSND